MTATAGRLPRLLSLSPALAALVVACPRPRDPDADPSAARRAQVTPAPPAKAPPAAARVRPMKRGEELGGPNATGKPGDWVLDNGEVVFVVEGLGGGSGFAESGGNVVDAADAALRKDELGQLFTYFGTFPRQAVYTQLEPRADPGGVAVLVAHGKELYEPAIEATTEYVLGPGARALLLRTTLHNGGAAPVRLGLGDAIQWGGAEKFAPGKPVGFKGRSSGRFVGGLGRFTSYAIASTRGDIAAVSGSVWTDTEQEKDVELEPGKSVTYERVFVVGRRGDAASVVSELGKAAGQDVGAVAITLVDASGKPTRASRGSKVVLSAPGGDATLSLVAAEEGETFGGEVPPGRWLVSYAASAGRRGDGSKVAVEVRRGETARAALGVSAPGALSAGCDAPCRIVVEGLEGTDTPDLGPHHLATAARNQLFAAERAATVLVAPGRYRLTATRGPEHTPEVRDVVVSPGAGSAAPVTFTLRRAVDTTGYVATDFHQHSMLSADAPVAVADRVRSNVVEGVEVAVASEHNLIADLGPVARELGLERWFVSIPGDEITTDADKDAWGHANVFPLTPRPDAPRAGAFAQRGRTPKDVFDEARRLPARPVIQINHPRSGRNGYFDRTGFDPATGLGARPGYDAAFDALEVWNGRDVSARARVLEDYLALLRTGHPVTPVGDTDTHGVVGQEAGYPRTYVRVTRDDALDAWDAGRSADLVRGVRELRDVVLTNGPFLSVIANGAPIGGVASARARGGLVEVSVRVQNAPFSAVERLELRVVKGAEVIGSREVAPDASGRATFRVRATKDDAFIVIASGTRPMRPLLSGDDREIAPWAMTGAIWIDADGDGKSLGR